MDDSVARAGADNFRGRTRRRQSPITFRADGNQSSFLEPSLKNRVLARGIAAVVADLRAEQARAHQNFFHA